MLWLRERIGAAFYTQESSADFAGSIMRGMLG